MEQWFERKLEPSEVRRYTLHRLGSKSFAEFFRRFSVTVWLVIVNVVFFIVASFFEVVFGEAQVLHWVAVQPVYFFSGAVWTLVTSMFMHGSLTHLFVNMVSLFFLGGFVEKLLGRKRFFWFYLVSGIVAGLFFVFLAYYFGTGFGEKVFGSRDALAVGASGAIFALGGLLAVLTPKMKVYVFFFIPMQMWVAMIFLLMVLWAASVGVGLPFGNSAHFGGLLVGVLYGVYLKKRYRRKTDMIAKYFSG